MYHVHKTETLKLLFRRKLGECLHATKKVHNPEIRTHDRKWQRNRLDQKWNTSLRKWIGQSWSKRECLLHIYSVSVAMGWMAEASAELQRTSFNRLIFPQSATDVGGSSVWVSVFLDLKAAVAFPRLLLSVVLAQQGGQPFQSALLQRRGALCPQGSLGVWPHIAAGRGLWSLPAAVERDLVWSWPSFVDHSTESELSAFFSWKHLKEFEPLIMYGTQPLFKVFSGKVHTWYCKFKV